LTSSTWSGTRAARRRTTCTWATYRSTPRLGCVGPALKRISSSLQRKTQWWSSSIQMGARTNPGIKFVLWPLVRTTVTILLR